MRGFTLVPPDLCVCVCVSICVCVSVSVCVSLSVCECLSRFPPPTHTLSLLPPT
eukprot:m.364784 g.364784  ORF g.364784 m.364784 type:complete len:54 (+) comp28451_c0_seq1:97-258(+)